ncbi:signal peptidase I [uncultured Ruminococcus sp.]|uniref:signal peptidase I n=1 Tax=uncultured Ruminococcus sp. TaxID=165186 RepID=UPI002931EE4F|nr:signal peptidase I [uncultured Ruminococcus sp.]
MNKLKQKIKDRLGEKKTAMLKKALNVTRIIKNIVCWTLIAILTLAVIIFVFTKINGETPKVFGYTLHRIVSGSMKPELEVGDVIVSKEIKEKSEIAIGDIVTFQGDARFENNKVTHRVLVAPYDNGRGATVIVTKGDANIDDDGEINVSDVESKYHSKIDFLKKLYNFFFTPWGLLVFIFVLLLVFFDEIMNIVKLSTQSAKENNDETIKEIVERVKREQLEEARKKQAEEKEALIEEQSASTVSEEHASNDEEVNASAIDEAHPEKKEIDTTQQKKEKAKRPASKTRSKQKKDSHSKVHSEKNSAGNGQRKTNQKKTPPSSKNTSKKKSKKRKKH